MFRPPISIKLRATHPAVWNTEKRLQSYASKLIQREDFNILIVGNCLEFNLLTCYIYLITTYHEVDR